MRTLFEKVSLIAVVVALAVLPARAGLQTDAQWTGGTNNIAAASTNQMRTSASTFSEVNARDITFQLTFATSAANTATNVFRLDNSDDNANWKTNVTFVNLTNDSTTGTNQTFTFTINVNSPGPSPNAPFWRAGQLENTNATVYYTNVVLKAHTKNGL